MSLSSRLKFFLLGAVGDPASQEELVEAIETGAGTDTLKADGSVPLTADLDADGNQVINLDTPSNDDDAATKVYVDDADALKQDAAFTPTTGSDWDPAPATIQDALDQLAARLTAIE